MAILGPQPVQNIDQILGGWGTLPFWCPLHVPCLSVYFSTWHRISPQILTGKPPVPWFLSLELSLELRKEPAQNLGSISSLCFVSQLSLSACLTSLFSFPSIPVFSEHLELCTELCLSTTDSIPVSAKIPSPSSVSLAFPILPLLHPHETGWKAWGNNHMMKEASTSPPPEESLTERPTGWTSVMFFWERSSWCFSRLPSSFSLPSIVCVLG